MADAPHEEWYRDGLRFECSRCGNCCTGPPGAVWFTRDEGKAMAAAIGVTEAMAIVTGQMTHAAAVDSATVVTRQYAKRQRTWFRARLRD